MVSLVGFEIPKTSINLVSLRNFTSAVQIIFLPVSFNSLDCPPVPNLADELMAWGLELGTKQRLGCYSCTSRDIIIIHRLQGWSGQKGGKKKRGTKVKNTPFERPAHADVLGTYTCASYRYHWLPHP